MRDDAHHVAAAPGGRRRCRRRCSVASRVRLQLAAFDHRDRQAFGGAVRRPELRVVGQQVAHRRDHVGRHRRAGRGHALHASAAARRGRPARASAPASRTAGSRRSASIACSSLRGSAFAGRVGSMSGMIEVRPSAGSNSANGGKVGRSTPPGCDAEGAAQHVDLRDEMPMPVHHALGHAGASREVNSSAGHVVGLRCRPVAGRPARRALRPRPASRRPRTSAGRR